MERVNSPLVFLKAMKTLSRQLTYYSTWSYSKKCTQMPQHLIHAFLLFAGLLNVLKMVCRSTNKTFFLQLAGPMIILFPNIPCLCSSRYCKTAAKRYGWMLLVITSCTLEPHPVILYLPCVLQKLINFFAWSRQDIIS